MTAAAVFDMDGVLIDSGAHHRHAWRMLLDEMGAEPADPEHWRLTIGRRGLITVFCRRHLARTGRRRDP